MILQHFTLGELGTRQFETPMFCSMEPFTLFLSDKGNMKEMNKGLPRYCVGGRAPEPASSARGGGRRVWDAGGQPREPESLVRGDGRQVREARGRSMRKRRRRGRSARGGRRRGPSARGWTAAGSPDEGRTAARSPGERAWAAGSLCGHGRARLGEGTGCRPTGGAGRWAHVGPKGTVVGGRRRGLLWAGVGPAASTAVGRRRRARPAVPGAGVGGRRGRPTVWVGGGTRLCV